MPPLKNDPLWYKDAIIYEVHVRAFRDEDADGVGDFKGLASRLDYLQNLGVTAIWLLPFYPSPLRDDGYDISDYQSVHPFYGSLRDFESFLKAAHRRGIRVITELVINHTSDQHPWFQRARRAAPGSNQRDFYVWSDTPDRYGETRIIFKDFEHSNWAWDPQAGAYYWHRFFSHQPDLNYDNPAVQRAVKRVMDFWFGMGVDGMRLDAVPYLYEREGTQCENLDETHEILKDLRRHLDRKYANRMFVAEANQWPEDAAAYFGDGDECHMNFHFPLMPRLFMAIHMEDRYPIIDILQQTPEIPENSQWALFLRNHDELTLEMVTDEERDYMYRVYADSRQMRINLGIRRRLAPLLGNNRRRIELMNALLFSLPGTPVIYYGDEIGMGDNVYLGDRNGVRTPMQWSADRNAGFSRANPQSLYLPVIIDPEYHYESVNVEAQLNNPHSLLWWMKRLIALRKRRQAFGRGSIEFLVPENRKILAFVRRYREEAVLVVANLSRYAQYASLDLTEFQGMVPVEMFGRIEFPAIEESGAGAYFLSLGPHAFYWFSLEKPAVIELTGGKDLPVLEAEGRWESILDEKLREDLEELLPEYVRERRWFGGKSRKIEGVEITDAIRVPFNGHNAFLTVLSVRYTDAEPETYVLPLAYHETADGDDPTADLAHCRVARLGIAGRNGAREGLLYDATAHPGFDRALLDAIARNRVLHGSMGSAVSQKTPAFNRIARDWTGDIEIRPGKAEQTNTSILFGDRFILKLYRRLHEGMNPDLEIGSFLSLRMKFPHVPPAAGHIEYRKGRRTPATLAFLQSFVPNEGDAWRFTLDQVEQFFERAASRYSSIEEVPDPSGPLLDLADAELPEAIREGVGVYLEAARLLGQRTAELHIALASDPDDPDFRPEPMTPFYRRSLYQSMRNLTARVFQSLAAGTQRIPKDARDEAREVLAARKSVLGWFEKAFRRSFKAQRIRTHGDYHLGQVLHTGRDFTIIDFEGEPARGIEERRLKRSPLRDVAGMIRSFNYAAWTALFTRASRKMPEEARGPVLGRWARAWHRCVSAKFLAAWLEAASGSAFLEDVDREELGVLLDVFLLEKAIYELGYELDNRPDWVRVPLMGILEILSGSAGSPSGD